MISAPCLVSCEMSLTDVVSICSSSGEQSVRVHSGIHAPLPITVIHSNSCICKGILDEKDLAAAEPAGTAAQRACFGRGFGELGWSERKTYLSHTEYWVLYGPLFPLAQQEAKHSWGSFGSVFCRKKHSGSSCPGSINNDVCRACSQSENYCRFRRTYFKV